MRAQEGAGRGNAAQHSQSLEAWFCHIPGLKVVTPSTPYDAKGLLKSAIRDDNPVIFLEHKLLYFTKGPVPAGDYTVPLGQAEVKRTGKDVTVVGIHTMVGKALQAAETLAGEGIELEVIDPRTLVPLDEETILNSVKKTGRLIVSHEAYGRAATAPRSCRGSSSRPSTTWMRRPCGSWPRTCRCPTRPRSRTPRCPRWTTWSPRRAALVRREI